MAQRIEEVGRRALTIQCDVSSEVQVDKMVDEVLSTWGRIDILVNNAGVPGRGKAIDFPEADFDQVMAVNVKGVFLCSRAVAPTHARAWNGIHHQCGFVFSVQGTRASPYAASKGVVLQLTRSSRSSGPTLASG